MIRAKITDVGVRVKSEILCENCCSLMLFMLFKLMELQFNELDACMQLEGTG